MSKNIAIHPGICEDGWYAYCPKCNYFDLEPTNIITNCPKCKQSIDWSWLSKFSDKNR